MSPGIAVGENAIIATVAAELRQLPAGSRAPSETDLIARFGVSRTRARAIIQLLEENHLVIRKQGSGTYVNRPLDYTITPWQRASLHGIVSEAGGTARTIVVLNERIPATPELAARLQVDRGSDVLHLQRVGFVDERPAAYLDEYLAPGEGELVGIALNLIESVEEVLCGYGYQPVRTWCRGTVDVPPDYAAERLGLTPAVQTWRLQSLLTDRATGRVLASTTSWSRMDVLRLVFETQLDPS